MPTPHSSHDRLGDATDLLDAARLLAGLDPDTLAAHPDPDRLAAAARELTALALDASSAELAARARLTPGREVLVVPVVHTTEGTTLTPWSDGGAVGFRASRPDGRAEYAYLYPSSGSCDPAEEGLATVFTYAGPHGNPDGDQAVSHLVLLTDEAAAEHRRP